MKTQAAEPSQAAAREILATLRDELLDTDRGVLLLTMELEGRVEERTAELAEVHAELQKTNSELLQLTIELEDRVKERTSELLRANKTLQAEILQRKQGERALRASEERYRIVANYTYDWEYWISPEGEILYMSPSCERITGYPAEEFIKHPERLAGIIHPDDRSAFEEHANLLVYKAEGEGMHELDFRIRRRDGEERWIAHACQPIRRPDGTYLGRRAANRDITGRKYAEEEIRDLNEHLEQRVQERTAQLDAANKELDAFSYSVSHDLRAPLRAVDGYTRIFEEDYQDRVDEEGRRILGVVRSEARRMGQLIDDLLAFSRLGRQAMHPAGTNMTALARGVFETLIREYPDRAVDFRLDGLADAETDEALMRQAWANLIGNAIKYTRGREPAQIEVGSRIEGNEIVYWIKDNGAGFDMKYADKLFGVFQRLHTQEEFEGTGVGLALVQRIVRRHGGRIWAESEVGHGATFYFTLQDEKENAV